MKQLLTLFVQKTIKPVLVVLTILAVVDPDFIKSSPIHTTEFSGNTLKFQQTVSLPQSNHTYSIFLSPDHWQTSPEYAHWLFKDDSFRTKALFIPVLTAEQKKMPKEERPKTIELDTVAVSAKSQLGAVSGLKIASNVKIPEGNYKVYLTTKSASEPPKPTAMHVIMQPEGGFFLKIQTLVETMKGLLSLIIGVFLSSLMTSKIRDFIGFE